VINVLLHIYAIIVFLVECAFCWGGRAIYYVKRQGFARTPTHVIKNGLCSKRMRTAHLKLKACVHLKQNIEPTLSCAFLYILYLMVTVQSWSLALERLCVQLSCIILHLTNFQLLILRSAFLRISPLAPSRQGKRPTHLSTSSSWRGRRVIIKQCFVSVDFDFILH
jgi:hypothetical protein